MRRLRRLLTLFIALEVVSCSYGTVEEPVNTKEASELSDSGITGEQLFNNRCMICHKLAPTHDELLAPPMRGIQMNYKRQFDTQQEFIDAIVNWASSPDSTKSIMPGALDQFGLMPYLSFKEEELQLIAKYIYDADFPRPVWAGDGGMHSKSQGKGMGHGKK